MRLGALASHEGTTIQAVMDACKSGVIDGSVAVVISNNSRAGALRRAKHAGIDALHISRQTTGSDEETDEAILQALNDRAVEVVLLAGYLRPLGPRTLERYRNRILNTHPSLLPLHGGAGMYGQRVHEAVLRAGDHMSGASVHLVTERYDEGEVLRQKSVPVYPQDTAEALAVRVQAVERELLVETIAEVACGKLLHPTRR